MANLEKTDFDTSYVERTPTQDPLDNLAREGKVKHVKVQSVALVDAVAKDSIKPWTSSMFQLYGIMVFCVLNDVMNGYDGSIMGSINAMDPFHDTFNVGMSGSGIGLVMAIYTVGNIVGSPLAGTLIDLYGRRAGMLSGSLFIILGTILQATAHSLGQFIGGRFVVGFGVPQAVTGAIVYLVELSHPTWRGVWGGFYNVFGWYVGSLTASWTCYGTGFMSTNWSWRIPVIIQAFPSLLVIIFVWFLPESPRWLFTKGRNEEARAVLIKYHGNGNPDSAVVHLECNEILESIGVETETSQKRWWDYRVLVNTRPNRYRSWLVLMVSVMSQFIGGAVISYYMPTILEGVGITGSSQQLLLFALNNVFSFIAGIFGASFVDKIGRRPLFLWGTLLTGLVYIPINVLAAKSGGNIGQGPGYAFIAMIFLYGIFWSFCWSPLQALYPAEVFNNEIRAKGIAAQSFIGGIASFINTYGTSVALQKIGWKTYTIFLILHFVLLVLMYLSIVETKGRSLEELEEIFEDPHPVKRSLQKIEIVVGGGIGAKMADDV